MSEPTNPPGPPPGSPPPPPSQAPPPPPGGGTTGGGTPPPSGGATPPGGGTASPNRGLMIVLSYLGILALIPLLVEKEDREVQWHAKHGLVLFVAEIIIAVVLAILGAVLTGVTAGLDFGCGGCVLQSIFWIVILVVHVMAIVKGVNGQRLIIPGISQYADRF